MTSDFTTGALILGALLLLAALVGAVSLRGTTRRGAGAATWVVLGIVGAVLLAWGVSPYFFTRTPQLAPILPPEELAPPPSASLPGEPAQAVTAALQDCTAPEAPPVPDAAKASKAEMIAARTAFQSYDAATNVYTHCVDAAVDAVTKQFPDASAEDLQTVRVLGTGAHNTAVDQEQARADQFNVQVRAFKTKHPE